MAILAIAISITLSSMKVEVAPSDSIDALQEPFA